MYHDLKGVYWSRDIKKDIAEFVAQCPNCQRIKVEHQKPGVDRLTKSAHFLPIKTEYIAEEYAKLYIKEIVRLHGVPIPIISNRGAQFTVKFWKSFRKSLGTQVIQQQLATAQSRHKSYANVRRRGLEFSIGHWVFLKVSPMKGVMRFGKKGKLRPCYIGPYKIIRRVGQVAYELELPQELSAVHSVFHVSMIRKCVGDPSYITSIEDVQGTWDLTYEEVPIAILDRQVKKLRNKEMASVKVIWRNQQVEEVT
ncbi:hypothetical protein MTR67_039205 [Solanum verrucosum]|uniref:Polyprotein n=1 Tax=Solanum verrucosum TaxID=315347 RepID=A0AAF0UGI3_SOLVR|nr:hypothetical protein MTR67_039205 [Solanum verrucosum]